MKAKVLKFRPAIDCDALDSASSEYSERETHLRRVHAVRKKIKTRTRWAKDFQKRLLSQLERAGVANGFTPTPSVATLPRVRAAR